MKRASKWIVIAAAAGLCGLPPAGTGIAQEPKAQAGGQPLSDAEIVAGLSRYLDEQVKADEFSGVVLLAKGGKPLFRKAYGMADLGLKVPNDPETKFNVGSIDKVFTRIAIQQLAEQGKLALADTIAQRLPDYPNQEVAAKVTIRQLLEFRSGLGDIFIPEFEAAAKDRFRTPRDLIALFADKPLLFAPGTEQRYSNAGYVVLGAIVEAVSGQGYDDYVREHIFQPAGMTATANYELDVPVPNRAVGYTREGPRGAAPGGGRRSNLFSTLFKGSPAGGGYSTADDLLRFDAALRSGLLFKDGHKIAGIGAAGGTGGCNALLEQMPEGYTLIVLSNYDPPAAEKIGRLVRGWRGEPMDDEDGPPHPPRKHP